MTSLGYPQLVQSGYSAPAAPTNTYDYDNMSRLADVQQDWGSGPGIVAQAVTYGPAGELTNFNYFGVTEARTYNQMLQLTHMTASAGGTLMDMEYNYSLTQNNGRITSSVDHVSSETVNYTYDSLNRQTGASVASGWSEAYGYDGFGNLTTKSQVLAPPLGISFDANNHEIGISYDANGNQTEDAAKVIGYGWDAENRMTGMAPMAGGTGPWNAYSYDPWGKRIMKHYHDSSGTDQQEYSFYGVTGQRLAVVFCDVTATPPCTISYETYFGGKLVRTGMTGSGSGSTKVTDRLGSVRWSQGTSISYYPYGEEKTSTSDGVEKFGTYFRDAAGQDYADQRYYNSDRGRFWSVDPGAPSYGNPGSLNRYAFVSGDPVNGMDRHGMVGCFIGIDPGCGDSPAVMTGDGGLGPCDLSQSQLGGGFEWGFVSVSLPPGCDTEEDNSGDSVGGQGENCEELLIDAMTGFLNKRYPSLASYAGQMEAVGASDDIDPRLFAAIVVAENGQAFNNPFSLGPNGSSTFSSIGAAISQAGKTLDKYIYTWNETTVSMLWNGNTWQVDPKKRWITTQPPGYCVGTDAASKASCQNTGKTISTFMTSMGGDPNTLKFPCND